MSDLIYTYYEGNMPEVIKKCTDRMKQYAWRIDAHYELCTTPSPIGHNPYVRALSPLVDPAYDDYDNIVIVDADVVPARNLTESVFDVGGHVALPDRHERDRMVRKRRAKGWEVHDDSIFCNGGIYKVTKEEREKIKVVYLSLLERYARTHSPHHHEEDLMHWVWHYAGIDAYSMGPKWNHCPRGYEEVDIADAAFHHLIYNGTKEESYAAVEKYVD